MLEEILAKASKVAGQADVFAVSSEETPVQFEANRLKHIQSKQTSSVALRLIKDGRLGFASSNRVDAGTELVEMALETAKFGQPVAFQLPPIENLPEVMTYDSKVAGVPLVEMVSLGQQMVDAVRKASAEIVCEAGVTKMTASIKIMNSRGGHTEYKKSLFSLGIEGTLVRGYDMLFVGDSGSSCRPMPDADEIIKTTLTQLERAKTQAKLSSKTMPVIFTPQGVASALTHGLMTAFNGKIVLEGASPLSDKLGKQVFDKSLSLADDATLAYRPTSRPCDDEGVVSRRIPLIDNGTVSSFLYDLKTAAKAGTQSTGSGGRGGGLPSPSPSAIVIESGDVSFEDMVADIKQGLIVEYLMGAGQGNVLGGDFSGNVLLGYKIEDGKIVGRVKDTVVSGNIYNVLKEVAAIGNDSRWVGGGLNTPSVYCPALAVASK